MSGCIGIGPSALLFPGARDAVKTALLLLLLARGSMVPQYLMFNVCVT